MLYLIEITNKSNGEKSFFNGFALDGCVLHHYEMKNYFTLTKAKDIMKMLKQLSWIEHVRPIKAMPPYDTQHIDTILEYVNSTNDLHKENLCI